MTHINYQKMTYRFNYKRIQKFSSAHTDGARPSKIQLTILQTKQRWYLIRYINQIVATPP